MILLLTAESHCGWANQAERHNFVCGQLPAKKYWYQPQPSRKAHEERRAKTDDAVAITNLVE